MKIEDCFELGKIIKAHGLKGEMTVMLDVDYPEDYEDLDTVFVKVKNDLVPYFVEDINISAQKTLLKLEGIDNVEQVNKLKNCSLYLPLEELPELDEENFYYHEVIGYEVIDDQKGFLGKVDTIYQLPAQSHLSVLNKGIEILIPIIEQFIVKVNHEDKQIQVSLPEGFVDVYLSDSNINEELN